MMIGGQQQQQQHLVRGTPFLPSTTTGTPQQLQPEREVTMAMAIALY
eukprot:CAMPEP_0168215760 /NCGR_PEP_ID=MMETSP0140_2-20121125/6172_1 /TAXON_ID=44445 /ORGANISM="Pseudo-nitzschia australis, Strain 10249 10 AB" /LENGTH=46 /DNA_ID= /DNA_START= /DNA_END= /DNA_ORIENTATION=